MAANKVIGMQGLSANPLDVVMPHLAQLAQVSAAQRAASAREAEGMRNYQLNRDRLEQSRLAMEHDRELQKERLRQASQPQPRGFNLEESLFNLYQRGKRSPEVLKGLGMHVKPEAPPKAELRTVGDDLVRYDPTHGSADVLHRAPPRTTITEKSPSALDLVELFRLSSMSPKEMGKMLGSNVAQKSGGLFGFGGEYELTPEGQKLQELFQQVYQQQSQAPAPGRTVRTTGGMPVTAPVAPVPSMPNMAAPDALRQRAIEEVDALGLPRTEKNIREAIRQLGG